MAKRRKARLFTNLAALLSAMDEGALTRAQVEEALNAVRMGIGLSKRDKALGKALEETGEPKDDPVWWEGFRAGLVEGYEGARNEVEAGNTLRPVADLKAEAQAEAQTAATGGRAS
jgi:hypothetical protein